MLKIIIPNNNIKERKYIIDILLGEFLGIYYEISIQDIQNYEIIMENGNKLIIEDHFFNKYPNDLEYLDKKNIPKKIGFTQNNFIVENDIPIIYGTSQFSIFNSKLIKCGIDVFASSFFMLTRWEEYVNKIRDKHNRFPAYASIAFKNNFLDRPIVNEYVEMLWNMLKFLRYNENRKKRNFKFILTHDVDHIFRYMNFYTSLKELAGYLFKEKNIKTFFEEVLQQFFIYFKVKKDPFDTFDYLMNISEEMGIKSHFFLHSSNFSRFDKNNDKYLEKIAKKILNKGHYLGYHPSYDSYNNLGIFLKDKEKIEKIIQHKLTFGRQHYLRFEIPTTWQVWEDAKMEWDSSLNYADKEGFRCGICYPYSVFNILKRQRLSLRERPLIVMDGNFVTYQSNLEPQDIENKIKNLIKKVKKYDGEFVFLWHNSSFNTKVWSKYKNIYNNALKN